MHDEKTVQRFIELRASDWTYERLITELSVSKPTLIAWSRKHQFQIQNLKAIEREALADKWLGSIASRVGSLGEQLRKVEAAISQRDVCELTTPQTPCPGPQPAPPDQPGHRPDPVHGSHQ
jgi:hypothetical protein